MDNFDLRKYLAEGRLLKEEFVKGTPQYYVKYTTQDGEEVKSELMSKREAIYKERDLVDSGVKKSSVHKIQKNMDLNGKEYEIEYELDKDIEYRTDEEGKPIMENIQDENKLLKEELTYQFSEYDFDITKEPGYQEEIIKKIKSIYPNIENDIMMRMIRDSEDYYYSKARSENKLGRDYELVGSDEFADSIIMSYKDQYLEENKLIKEYLDLEIDEDEGQVTITSSSGEYSGFIEDDNTVDFSVYGYQKEREDWGDDFDEYNWKNILGKKHAFVKIFKQLPETKVEAAGDYVMITVDLEDLKAISEKNSDLYSS